MNITEASIISKVNIDDDDDYDNDNDDDDEDGTVLVNVKTEQSLSLKSLHKYVIKAIYILHQIRQKIPI